MNGALAGTDVIVLAGGLGSRIRPVLGDRPKILAPVAGRPFLDHLLRFLARHRARKVVLSLGHLAESVTAYIAGLSPALPVETVIEDRPLGTAGAIGFARRAVASDPVLVLNGDTWLEIDFAAMLAAHRREPGTLATIACVRVPDAGRYGRVELADDGAIRRFSEKESGPGKSLLINAGIYLLSAGLMDDLARGPARSLEREVFPRLAPGTLCGFVADGRGFIDIGTPESYARAETVMAAAKP
ncbi:MAG TPA: nucleotidyltransferase family protein [Candidatus Udaeobacter sp.]|nr:nucleotidyltransferase family protein [Candidatus Udaeobacter sp.]